MEVAVVAAASNVLAAAVTATRNVVVATVTSTRNDVVAVVTSYVGVAAATAITNVVVTNVTTTINFGSGDVNDIIIGVCPAVADNIIDVFCMFGVVSLLMLSILVFMYFD